MSSKKEKVNMPNNLVKKLQKESDNAFVAVSQLQVMPEPKPELKAENLDDNIDRRFVSRQQFTYFKKYDNVKVHIKLIDGEEFDGIVHMKLNDNYDFELETLNSRIFIMKHSILYLYPFKEAK
jgi:sRNA-binding regulator protein Hfq